MQRGGLWACRRRGGGVSGAKGAEPPGPLAALLQRVLVHARPCASPVSWFDVFQELQHVDVCGLAISRHCVCCCQTYPVQEAEHRLALQHRVDHPLGRAHGEHQRSGPGGRPAGHLAIQQWQRLRQPLHGARRHQLGLLGRCRPGTTPHEKWTPNSRPQATIAVHMPQQKSCPRHTAHLFYRLGSAFSKSCCTPARITPLAYPLS